MSFSSDIKEILCKTEYECPGCRRAELAGFFVFPARLAPGARHVLCSQTGIAERTAAALAEEMGVPVRADGRRLVLGEDAAQKIIRSLSGDAVLHSCCATGFARGAFLAAGSVSDPSKEYHLEFGTNSFDEAQHLIGLLEKYGFNPRGARRRDKKIVYIKESGQIADLIGYMSGGRAGLEILSTQVEKELKSSAQRRVNCDSANLTKQAKASARQIAAIKKIKAARKWSAMPDVLREIGDLRLKNPDLSIEELGKKTDPPIGKSGVNHRLKRIIEYAESVGGKL